MEIKIKDEKLRKILKEKAKVLKEGAQKAKEAHKLQETLDKILVKRNDLISRVHSIVNEMDLDIGEFEAIENVEIRGGDIIATTFDVVEEFKKTYKEEQNAESKPDLKDDPKAKAGSDTKSVANKNNKPS